MSEGLLHDSRPVLVVEVDGLRVAWACAVVVEVFRMVAIDVLPGSPEVVAGVVDVRGRIVPVLDLRRRLGRSARPPTLNDRLVSVAWDDRHPMDDGRPMGDSRLLVRVDAVHGLRPLDPTTVEPLDRGLAATPHLAGIGRGPQGMLFVQDPAAFLTDREAVQLGASLEHAPGGPHGG